MEEDTYLRKYARGRWTVCHMRRRIITCESTREVGGPCVTHVSIWTCVTDIDSTVTHIDIQLHPRRM